MLKSIILLYSLINTGDVSHGKVLVELLKQDIPTLEVTLIDANLPADALEAEYKKIESKLNPQDSMILAVGEKGLSALSTKCFKDSKIPLGASVHMYFDTLQSLPLNFLAIPETESKKGSLQPIPNITYTLTVPSKNPTQNELKTAYETWELKDKPSADTPYIIVMLPGDAVDQNGKMNYFTKPSAKKLFDDVIALRKQYGEKYTILVQNGPRTGKHNPENGQILCSHEYEKGQDPNIAIDGVSQYFIDLLKQQNIPYAFFNFAFEIDGKNKKALSVFNPLLYLAQAKEENYFIVPGESVTMLGQIPLYLKPSQVMIFKPDSMNASHKAIFEVIKDRGHLSYFAEDHTAIPPKHPVQLEKDDASVVAKGILKTFEPKAKHSFFSKLTDGLENLWNKIVDLIHRAYASLKNKFGSKPTAAVEQTLTQPPPQEAPVPTAPKIESVATKPCSNDESSSLKSTRHPITLLPR